jgi:hypothetical protein
MAQIDFPPASLDQQFTAQNGIVYVCVGVNPTVWQVVDQAANTGQRLWNRDGINNYIYPIFPGDDVYIRDSAGNATTIITGGNQSKSPSLKTENLLFAHMQPLPPT